MFGGVVLLHVVFPALSVYLHFVFRLFGGVVVVHVVFPAWSLSLHVIQLLCYTHESCRAARFYKKVKCNTPRIIKFSVLWWYCHNTITSMMETNEVFI